MLELKTDGFEFAPRTACPLCEQNKSEPFGAINWKDIRFNYVVCSRCGLVYMDPVPTPESYVRFYQSSFWAIKDGRAEDWRGKRSGKDAGHSIKYQQKTRIPRIEQMVGSLPPLAHVLEVGCGYGETLAHLTRRYGVQPFAVEPSDDAVSYMREKYPSIKVIARSIEELFSVSPYDASFDLVIFSHCLENIVDTNAALEARCRLLKPDGRLYIDTPNLYWAGGMNPYHPVVFSPDTLTASLRKHGLKVERIDADPAPTNLLSASLKPHKKWCNLIATKAEAAPPPLTGNAGDIKRAFRVSRKVLTVQARMRRVRLAVKRRVRI